MQDPVAIDWDPAGRLWVVEMPGYMRTVTGAGEHDPIGRIVVLADRDGDGRMDTRAVFADGLVMARAIKVLERGVLVGEPPNAWLMHDTDGDLRMDTKELVSEPVRAARRRSAEQRQRVLLGARQPDVHGRADDGCASPEERRVRGHALARARPVGRGPGRCRPHLPQHQRIGAARGPGADAVFRAQSESPAHARQLRTARRRQSRAEHRVAGTAEPGHQSRLPVRDRSRRRIARAIHGGLRAARLSRRSAARRAPRERVRRRTGRERREPHRPAR